LTLWKGQGTSILVTGSQELVEKPLHVRHTPSIVVPVGELTEKLVSQVDASIVAAHALVADSGLSGRAGGRLQLSIRTRPERY
jgi:hypothetical protein